MWRHEYNGQQPTRAMKAQIIQINIRLIISDVYKYMYLLHYIFENNFWQSKRFVKLSKDKLRLAHFKFNKAQNFNKTNRVKHAWTNWDSKFWRGKCSSSNLTLYKFQQMQRNTATIILAMSCPEEISAACMWRHGVMAALKSTNTLPAFFFTRTRPRCFAWAKVIWSMVQFLRPKSVCFCGSRGSIRV